MSNDEDGRRLCRAGGPRGSQAGTLEGPGVQSDSRPDAPCVLESVVLGVMGFHSYLLFHHAFVCSSMARRKLTSVALSTGSFGRRRELQAQQRQGGGNRLVGGGPRDTGSAG